MPLPVGELAPPFEAQSYDGTPVRLAEHLGRRRVVLFFYPRDFSFFCTREACGFRDLARAMPRVDVIFVGISRDSAERHREFAKRFEIPFPLVSDTSCQIGTLYRATSMIRSAMGVNARVTYVIDRTGRIQTVIEGALTAMKHVEGVRAVLEKEA